MDNNQESEALRDAAKSARTWNYHVHGACEFCFYHRGYTPDMFSRAYIPTLTDHG